MQLKKKITSFASKQTISIFKKMTLQAINKKGQITNHRALHISKILDPFFFCAFFLGKVKDVFTFYIFLYITIPTDNYKFLYQSNADVMDL